MMTDYDLGGRDCLNTFADVLEAESRDLNALVPIARVAVLLREAAKRVEHVAVGDGSQADADRARRRARVLIARAGRAS